MAPQIAQMRPPPPPSRRPSPAGAWAGPSSWKSACWAGPRWSLKSGPGPPRPLRASAGTPALMPCPPCPSRRNSGRGRRLAGRPHFGKIKIYSLRNGKANFCVLSNKRMGSYRYLGYLELGKSIMLSSRCKRPRQGDREVLQESSPLRRVVLQGPPGCLVHIVVIEGHPVRPQDP